MPAPTGEKFAPPILHVAATWENVAAALAGAEFEERWLPALLRQARWFGGKAHPLHRVRVVEMLRVGDPAAGRIALLEASYADRPSEIYLLPLQLAPAAAGPATTVIARLGESVLFDALDDEQFRAALFAMVLRGSGHDGLRGLCGAPLEAAPPALPLPSRALAAEQSNSAIVFDGRFFMKLYRKPEAGENPDAELIRFLSERQKFAHVPAFCGAIEHRGCTLALVVANVPGAGDAWAFTLAAMDEAAYPDRVRQLARRTAGMHLALAAEPHDPAFAPEPFTAEDRRTLCEATSEAAHRTMQLLGKKLAELPDAYRGEAAVLLTREAEILARLSAFSQRDFVATRTRHHGDYHLGQVLNTGSDFVIIDFEGEPARTLAERRMKRSPLRDVAGMLRSFHYAAYSAEPRRTRAAAETWARKISRVFFEEWLATVQGASFLPENPAALPALLEIHLIEKALYEIQYELNHRPDWTFIPMLGLAQILAEDRPPPP